MKHKNSKYKLTCKPTLNMKHPQGLHIIMLTYLFQAVFTIMFTNMSIVENNYIKQKISYCLNVLLLLLHVIAASRVPQRACFRWAVVTLHFLSSLEVVDL